jgi:hypothetical protein
VGSVNQNGQLLGLLADLKLVLHSKEKGGRVYLTESGWTLATLRNPFLEKMQERPSDRFSDAEISFLLNHVAENVPIEDFAFRTTLVAIREGADTPDKLDEALKLCITKERAAELRESFLCSQRSGAISRMTDLGLVLRVRNGVRVSYLVTEQGEAYLESNK